jgi:hypothetical protein
MDGDEWARALVEHYGMDLVETDPDAVVEMAETSVHGHPAVRVFIPVVWTDTLEVIARQGLAGQKSRSPCPRD